MLHRPSVPDHVIQATAKMGIHPHHLTKEQVVAALADGTISEDECNGLLYWIDNNEQVNKAN